MAKVYIKTDDKCIIPDVRLQSDLEAMMDEVEKVPYLEEAISKAVGACYQLLPNGKENYGGKNPKIGFIDVDWNPLIDLDSDDSYPHISHVMCSVSSHPTKPYINGVQITLAEMDLKKKTYDLMLLDMEVAELPPILAADTKAVMKMMGFKKKYKRK